MIKTFIKKPVEIQALLWDGYNYNEIRNFVGDVCDLKGSHHDPDLVIHTLEGDHRKPDIFNQTYEEKK